MKLHRKNIIVLILAASCAGCFAANITRTVTTVAELLAAVAEIKNAPASDDATIILRPRTYLLTDTIVFDNISDLTIQGCGWNTVLQKIGSGGVFRFNACSNVKVKDLRILGDVSATSGSGIEFAGKSGGNDVDYCRIMYFAASGVRFEGTLGNLQKNNSITDCHFIGNRTDQLVMAYNDGFMVSGNQFGTHQSGQLDPAGELPETGVVISHCTNGQYTVNYHWDNRVAFKMLDACENNRFINNRFEESRQEGIKITASSDAPCKFNLFKGNTIHSNSKFNSGLFNAVTAVNCYAFTFSDNQIFSWNETRMKHCVELGEGCEKWIVTDNILHHNQVEPEVVYGQDSGHIVTDNKVE